MQKFQERTGEGGFPDGTGVSKVCSFDALLLVVVLLGGWYGKIRAGCHEYGTI